MRVLVSAGEVSGDQHLARVVLALKRLVPEVQVRGMAGRACAAAGVELDVDCYTAGSTMGFVELLRSAGSLARSFSVMKNLLRTWMPDVLILVDYPGFNLRLAKIARQCGVRVLYYIPPKVWAWKAWRVAEIKRYVDHVAAIFPFEPGFFGARGYSSVTYVGHPLADVAAEPSDPNRRPLSLLLLPGSRRFEVQRLLPPLLRVFARLKCSHPELKGVVLVAPNMESGWLRDLALGAVSPEVLADVDFRSGDALHEAQGAFAAILKSGTCNLEGALALVPFVSVYSGSLFSKVIASALVPLQEYSPVNIIRSGTVRELMQVTLDEEALYAAMQELLTVGDTRARVIEGLREVRSQLLNREGGSSDTVDGAFTPTTVAERVAVIVRDGLKAA